MFKKLYLKVNKIQAIIITFSCLILFLFLGYTAEQLACISLFNLGFNGDDWESMVPDDQIICALINDADSKLLESALEEIG